MKFVKVRFLKGDMPHGRAYTYKSEQNLQPGDKVKVVNGSLGIVIEEQTDTSWIEAYGAENIKGVEKYEEEENGK